MRLWLGCVYCTYPHDRGKFGNPTKHRRLLRCSASYNDVLSHCPFTSTLTNSQSRSLEMDAARPGWAPEVALRVELHTFRTPDSEYMPKGEGLWVCAKRYSTEDSVKDIKGLTLLFTHCIGSSAQSSNLFRPPLIRRTPCPLHMDLQARKNGTWSYRACSSSSPQRMSPFAFARRGRSIGKTMEMLLFSTRTPCSSERMSSVSSQPKRFPA